MQTAAKCRDFAPPVPRPVYYRAVSASPPRTNLSHVSNTPLHASVSAENSTSELYACKTRNQGQPLDPGGRYLLTIRTFLKAQTGHFHARLHFQRYLTPVHSIPEIMQYVSIRRHLHILDVCNKLPHERHYVTPLTYTQGGNQYFWSTPMFIKSNRPPMLEDGDPVWNYLTDAQGY